MDGQQMAWVIIICVFFFCVMITSVANSFSDRNKIQYVDPPENATPEVWVEFYKMLAAIGTRDSK